MTHPNDLLVSVADDALRAAEADAAKPTSSLIFREEWRPTPRTRSSLNQPPRPPISGTRSFLEILKDQAVEVAGGISRVISPGLEQHRPAVQPLVRSTSAPISGLPPAVPDSFPQPSIHGSPSSVFDSAATSPLAPSASVPVSPSPPTRPNLEEGAVGELLRENRDDYDEVINHAFPRAMGDGTASLDGFRYYMLQDRLYLQMCIGLKMISAAAGTHDFDAMKGFEFRHKSSIEYVTSLEETCTTMLGITRSMIDESKRSSAIKTSENYYMTTLRSNNPVLGYYVVLLPCILTYWVIANRLMNDPKTAKNVVYHSAWTEVNDDTSSVQKYIKFINENIAAEGHFAAWSSIFKIACKLEADMFKTGLNPPAAYKIIEDGTYSINVACGGFVLAILDVADVVKHQYNKSLADYCPTNTKTCVVGIKGSGGSEEKWQISSTPSGYTIQNIGTGIYLASRERNSTSRILQPTAEPYYWWINPVKTKLGERLLRYQIYDTANLRFTLHAEIEAPGSNESNCIPVVAQENILSPSQIWTFSDGVERPVELNNLTAQHDREMQALRGDAVKNVEKDGADIMAEMDHRASHHDHELQVLKENTRNSVAAFRAEIGQAMERLTEMHKRELEALKAEMLADMTKLRDQCDHKALHPADRGECHWERLTRRIFHPSDLEAQPVRLGGRGATARYIMRARVEDSSGHITDIGDGEECDTRQGQREFWVLVGRGSYLKWVPCSGRFRACSIDEELINPARDGESREPLDTMYIALFVHGRDEYITYVKEGQNGVSKRIRDRRTLNSEEYEVLCYKTAL